MWSRVNEDPSGETERLAEMIAQTDREILAEAMGEDEDGSGVDVEEQSRINGWDSEPISDIEVAAQNIYGFNEDGHDRPVQLSETQHLQAQLVVRDEEMNNLRGFIDTAVRQPQTEQANREFEDRLLNMAAENPAALRENIQSLQMQASSIQENHLNQNLEAAYREHGADFEAAYTDLTSMDPRDPAARSIVQSITSSRDPGAALMAWHQSPGGTGYVAQRDPPPFMAGRGSRGAPSRGASRSDREGDMSGFGSRGWKGGQSESADADIFASVWE